MVNLEANVNDFTEFARKAELRKSVIRSSSAIIGYVWAVVVNVFVLAVIFTIYSNIFEPSTKFIFSCLLLIYITIISTGAAIAQQNALASLFNLKLQLRVQRTLVQDGVDDLEAEREEIEMAEYQLEKLRYKYYINSVFSFIIFLIGIYSILTSSNI